ncbi:hypothetical protein [Streptomyces sp. NBC_01443]|uniref:hypothetical protein n=1 Tax=Streptomyces sp. NBC_01443 TaxID=2903868 RepID=UPI002254B128|nr:hypothetical protein [Streptomyces sp. NBC_01443]MCX4632982.1 hypothetical protein [Streptomyces sp. NBC_01443]
MSDDSTKSFDEAIGTHIRAITYDVMDWATEALPAHVSADDLKKLKLAAGEHLAAMLTTAYLGIVPVAADVRGGVDLVYRVADLDSGALSSLLGRNGVEFADFEVKSIPRGFREHDAAISRALKGGEGPGTHLATVVSANDVVEAARPMIDKAAKQLREKSSPDRARVAFIMSHFFDWPYTECLDLLIAHTLNAPTLPDEIDAMWVFFAPSHLVVWSAVEQHWTQLLLGSLKEDSAVPEIDFDMELLQHYEGLFLERAGIEGPSPFYYGIKTVEVETTGNSE